MRIGKSLFSIFIFFWEGICMIEKQLNMLLKLQELEISEEKLDAKLKGNSMENEILLLQKAIVTQHKKLKDKHENIKLLSRKVKIFEHKLNQLDAIVEQLELKIYSGEVITLKELNQLQQKQEKTKQQVGNTEDAALKLMDEVEKLKKTFIQGKNDLRQKKDEYREKQLKTREKIDKINEESNRIELLKQDLLKNISPRLLDKYRKIKKSKREAVASVLEGKCSGCRMGISILVAEKVSRGDSLVYCENCGRILIK